MGPQRAVLEERLRTAERDLEGFVRPNTLTLDTPAALGVMAIASIRAQFMRIAPAAAAIS